MCRRLNWWSNWFRKVPSRSRPWVGLITGSTHRLLIRPIHKCKCKCTSPTSSARKRSLCRKLSTILSLSLTVFLFTWERMLLACWLMLSCREETDRIKEVRDQLHSQRSQTSLTAVGNAHRNQLYSQRLRVTKIGNTLCLPHDNLSYSQSQFTEHQIQKPHKLISQSSLI